MSYPGTCHSDFYEQIIDQNPGYQVRVTPGGLDNVEGEGEFRSCVVSRARFPRIKPGKGLEAGMEFECPSLHQGL